MSEAKTPPELHRGHDLETGLLARLRDWTDLLGWLRLVRTLRIAASPTMVGMVATAFAIWLTLTSALSPRIDTVPNGATPSAWGIPHGTLDVFSSLHPVIWLVDPRKDESTNLTRLLLNFVFATLLWTPLLLILTRQGARLTAGLEMESLTTLARRSITRTPIAWLIPLVPIACATVLALPAFGLAWCLRVSESIWVIQLFLGVLLVLGMMPVGLLLFGSLFASPLGYAAIANEENPDSLDALSRGYESLLRRPLHLFGNLMVAVVLMIIVWAITSGAAHFAIEVAAFIMGTVGVSKKTICLMEAMIQWVPQVVNLTLCWALVGGIYLLLREATCQQHVEDLWVPFVDDESNGTTAHES